MKSQILGVIVSVHSPPSFGDFCVLRESVGARFGWGEGKEVAGEFQLVGILLWYGFALVWLQTPVKCTADNGFSRTGWADSSENMLCTELFVLDNSWSCSP